MGLVTNIREFRNWKGIYVVHLVWIGVGSDHG